MAAPTRRADGDSLLSLRRRLGGAVLVTMTVTAVGTALASCGLAVAAAVGALEVPPHAWLAAVAAGAFAARLLAFVYRRGLRMDPLWNLPKELGTLPTASEPRCAPSKTRGIGPPLG